MSGKFVRASKFRHVYGQSAKKEACYENLKPTISAFDSNIIQSNGRYIALNANGIGSFCVIPVDEVGKAPDKAPMFRGHTGGSVLDTAFDPFNERRIVSSGEDGKILVWEIPEDYSYYDVDPENIVDVHPIGSLTGHSRKVGHLQFNPVAKDVLASSSFDYTVKVWDLGEKECKITLKHKDLITSFTFNYNGTKIATVSRDKKVRVWDVRTGELLSEGPSHLGAKASRVVWLGNTNRLATTGFDRFSERQLGLWDSDDLTKGCIGGFISIDSSSGTLMPFFDPSTNLLFVAGKGDGNVRFFEFADDDLHLLGEYPSTEAQRGFTVSPKRFVNVKENEIVKGYKLLNSNTIEPLSFIVPRRSEMFQEDIYPDAPAGEPAMTAAEYFDGKTVDGPILCSMEDIYNGNTPALSESKPEQKITKETKQLEKSPQVSSTPVIKEPSTPQQSGEKEEPRLVFTKSQEQGVESMLSEKKVDSLLDKVNDLSDIEQEIDTNVNEDEWDSKPEQNTPKQANSVVTQETPKESPKESPVSASASETPKEVLVTSSTPETPKTVNNDIPGETPDHAVKASPQTTSAPKGAAAGGLKASLDKLHALIQSLESNIEQLTTANQAKDERLAALEKKIDQLLQK